MENDSIFSIPIHAFDVNNQSNSKALWIIRLYNSLKVCSNYNYNNFGPHYKHIVIHLIHAIIDIPHDMNRYST